MKRVHTKRAVQKYCSMEKHMKRVQHENNATQKKCKMKRIKHRENASWKKQNMERVQHEKCATSTKYKDKTKFGKKGKRRLHYSAQTDNRSSVNRPFIHW